jgi:predicted nucleic acid-binding protein
MSSLMSARTGGDGMTRRSAHEYAGLLQPLIVVDELDLKRGLELLEQRDRLGAFDAFLAASVARRGARALVSTDEALGDIPGVLALNPGRELVQILRG